MSENKQQIPYGAQSIDDDDIKAVHEVLRSDWLTTGPKVEQFEEALAREGGVKEAVVVSSGTAALHTAVSTIGVIPGDEVIVPTITFAATANCVRFCGGTVVFADVIEDTLLVDPDDVAQRITPKTKAIIAVDYAGQPCDYDALKTLADKHGLVLIADACHSLGGAYKGRPVGSLADMTCLSFHPVKHIATGEGGAVLTNRKDWASAMKRFRNHGIDTTARQRTEKGHWSYEMVSLGYNYRISDIQCALGVSQLKKLSGWVRQRNIIAQQYDQALSCCEQASPIKQANYEHIHAYHLYVIRVQQRELVFNKLREVGIGVNVHYEPLYKHPYYHQLLGDMTREYPVTEKVFKEILSLPIFPTLSREQQIFVIDRLLAPETHVK